MQPQLLEELKAFMALSNFPWAVCGGFALDLFLGKNIRTHGDMDICVFEKDRESIKKYALDRGWRVYEFRGQGKVRPLESDLPSDAGRNLMCVRNGCDIVKFYPCEEEGMLYHRFFHTGMKEFHYLEFLFNSVWGEYLVLDQRNGVKRELQKAILNCGGFPCLAPEIVLLYKATDFTNPGYQLDFDETVHCLSEEQRTWFLREMKRLYPNGHAWIRQSDSTDDNHL
jgi:hypothetical protein